MDSKTSTSLEETFQSLDLDSSRAVDTLDLIQLQDRFEIDSGNLDVPADKTTPKKRKGKKGKKVQLFTNYVRVTIGRSEEIHEYRVSFTPKIDNLDIRKRFLNDCGVALGETKIFDGMMLFLPNKLPDEEFVIEGLHPKNQKVRLKANIKYIRCKPKRELSQFFNVLFRKLMAVIGNFELKRNFLNRDVKYTLHQHKLTVWPGICTSVEEQEAGLLLCLDTSYRVFRTDTVYDYYCALNDTENWEEIFRTYILGKVVVTRYNNFTYKIDDIDWIRSPLSLFVCKGKTMTYVEYYKSFYKIEISNKNQPLLLSRIKVKNGYQETEEIKIVSIIPELCYVSGMDQEQRSDETLMKELRRYTFVTPAQRAKALSSFVKRINEIPEALEVLDKWNVKIENQLLNVEGREIFGPNLQLCKNLELKHAGANFVTDSSQTCLNPVSLKNWLVICPQRDIRSVKRFIDFYKQECRKIGIEVSHPGKIISLKGHNPQDFRDALEDYADPKLVHFLIIVMPHARQEIYAAVKKVCVAERGIPSQVILAKNLISDDNFMTVVRNMTLQINCKLGGSLWGLKIPLQERIMFVGIDVNHDVKKVHPSTVALVASMNNTCTKYFTKVHIQRIHQEITDNMKPMFSEALECYQEMNGAYPDRVVIFRDGGSLSAMGLLIEHEVKPMLSAIKDFCPQLKYFTYAVVSKRVPQKFFMKDKYNNILSPNPGTVIDQTVTYPDMFDFYLVSQQKSVGTINPTHYMVISDIGGIHPDLMQKFAYSTTFMYYNWAGTIGVPAMIQYAHKVSALVGQHLRMDPSKSLETTLYYL